MQGGELTINTTTKVMKGKKVLFTYAKPKTFKFTKTSFTLKRGTANTDLSRSDKSVFEWLVNDEILADFFDLKDYEELEAP